MKAKIFNMIRFLAVLSAMITAIVVGAYAIIYALIHSAIYIGLFAIGGVGLAFGLYTLNIVAEKLK
tara:strand:+ start:262 stop:459 length:198 start_codon:yes stop_codon:yes gene_type:complete